MPLLPTTDIDKIYAIAIQRHLFDQRSVLVAGLDPYFAASMERNAKSDVQLMLDLYALNSATRVIGGDLPLRQWLTVAAALVEATVDDAATLRGFAAGLVAQPEASAADVKQAANLTLETIRSLSQEHDNVRDALRDARGAIANTGEQLTRLVTRKRLHDVLHELQIEGMPLLQSSVTRERFNDPAQLPMIVDQLYRIEVSYNDARSELDALDPGAPGYKQDEGWIEALGAIAAAARSAAQDRTFDPAKKAIGDLRRLIKIQMPRLNDLLIYGLQDLDISSLADHLREFAALALPPSDPRAMQLRDAATRLLLLQEEVTRLVEAHDQWQRVDNDFWDAEDNLILRDESAGNLETFFELWPRLSLNVQGLAGKPPADWYMRADAWAQQFIAKCPMPVTPPLADGAREDFKYFMSTTRRQFRQVDLELKGTCNRLDVLTRPLKDLGS